MTALDLVTCVQRLSDTTGGPLTQTKLAVRDAVTQHEVFQEFTVAERIGDHGVVFFALVPVAQPAKA